MGEKKHKTKKKKKNPQNKLKKKKSQFAKQGLAAPFH